MSEKPKLRVEVVWGDVTRVAAHVYAVGHYTGVPPQRAEEALDELISPPGVDREERFLALRTGRLDRRWEPGDVCLRPWHAGHVSGDDQMDVLRGGTVPEVAVCAMGEPGRFGRDDLEKIVAALFKTVLLQPRTRVVASVLIGSGEGNLRVSECVSAYLTGIEAAMKSAPEHTVLETLRVVEVDLGKVSRIRDAFMQQAATDLRTVSLAVAPEVAEAEGRTVSGEFGVSLAATAAAWAVKNRRPEVVSLLSALPERLLGSEPDERRSDILAALERMAPERESQLLGFAQRVRVHSEGTPDPRAREPRRLSIIGSGPRAEVAAVTGAAIVRNREIVIDTKKLDTLSKGASGGDRAHGRKTGLQLARLLIPDDFLPYLEGRAPIVFETDRELAAVPWEMLLEEDASNLEPIGLRAPVARQLRTKSTREDPPELSGRRKTRALVIGDPASGRLGLPASREEAQEVERLLGERGVEVECLIGSPKERCPGYDPARLEEVRARLTTNVYDLVHYTGHGELQGGMTGWLFEGQLLVESDLRVLKGRAPRLVFSNACLAGRVSTGETTSEVDLADGFFRHGVLDFIGSAWTIQKNGPADFAISFYRHLLPTAGARSNRLGEALLAARKDAVGHGTLWAAYRHYGDPNRRFVARRSKRVSDTESAVGDPARADD